MTAAPRLERLEGKSDFAVDPDSIERQLSALWREASESRGGAAAVTRACLWNVIAYVPEGGPSDLRDAIGQLATHIASRTLVLQVGAADAEAKLDAWVSANCILAEGGGKLVCSEEVTLAASGEDRQHLPGLVRALLVPGVPTALVCLGVPYPDEPLMKALLRVSDRVVFDASAVTPSALSRATQAMARCRLGGIDLGWLRRAALRKEVASLFDPPATAADVDAVVRIEARAASSEVTTARLMLGWVSAVLGLEPTPAGEGTWSSGARTLRLIVEEARTGLALTFDRDDGTARAVECGARLVSSGPGAGPDRPPGTSGLDALVARALATRTEDATFASALAAARSLDG